MWNVALSKVVMTFLLLFKYVRPILTQDLGLISKSKWSNSPVAPNGQSANKVVNGEKLIVAEGISCWEQNGHWEKLEVCPESTIVTAHRFRYLVRTGLTGIQLKCTQKYGQSETESEHILQMNSEPGEKNIPRGKWSTWKNGSRSVFAEGFSFNRGELSLRRSVQNYNVIYHSGNQTVDSDKMYLKCPEDHAICGLTAMMDKAGLGILTSIGLKCCHHCVPMETWVTIHRHDNVGEVEVEKKVETTFGLQRIPQNGQSDINSTKSRSNFNLVSDVRNAFSASFGNSSSAGFDWTLTLSAIWDLDETTITQKYSCGVNRSCVLKQLVGHCGSVQVPVNKVCDEASPIGSSNPDSCRAILDSHPFWNCGDGTKMDSSAKQRIYPHGNKNNGSLEVLCDFETDGGGWTIIQKRSSGPREEFNRTWNEYETGFGSFDKNFWIGLKNIRALTKNGDQELRIELEDFEGEKRHAKYPNFSISDASDFYRLSIRGFSGDSTLQDDMAGYFSLNGQKFTTTDNDDKSSGNCAVSHGGGGGWWFHQCAYSNLNGLYFEKGEFVPSQQGIRWFSWKGFSYSLAKSEMKIRKRKKT